MARYLIKNTSRSAATRQKRTLAAGRVKRTLNYGVLRVGPERSRIVPPGLFDQVKHLLAKDYARGACEVYYLEPNKPHVKITFEEDFVPPVVVEPAPVVEGLEELVEEVLEAVEVVEIIESTPHEEPNVLVEALEVAEAQSLVDEPEEVWEDEVRRPALEPLVDKVVQKLKKSELQVLCETRGVVFAAQDTRRTLIGRLLGEG